MQALNERIELRLDQETIQGIDAWRSRQDDVPARSEAIRRLVGEALTRAPTNSHKDPRFTPGETLIIHMLCELMKAGKVTKEIDPEFVRNALFGGHNWALGWDMSGIFHHDIDSSHTLTEVVDILDMFDMLERSYERLSPKEKAQLKEDADPFGSDVKFRGFDGNNETEHMSIARFLITDMGRWERFKKRELNSHFPVIESYRRMLRAFLPLRHKPDGGSMTVAKIVEILLAQTHPEYKKK